jgi:hypothetical protein
LKNSLAVKFQKLPIGKKLLWQANGFAVQLDEVLVDAFHVRFL